MTLFYAYKFQKWTCPDFSKEPEAMLSVMNFVNSLVPLAAMNKWGSLLEQSLNEVRDTNPRLKTDSEWRRARFQCALGFRILLNFDRSRGQGSSLFVNLIRGVNKYDFRMLLRQLPDGYFDTMISKASSKEEKLILENVKLGNF